MTLDKWLHDNAARIHQSNYHPGLYEFTDFCRYLAELYGIERTSVQVFKSFDMYEPDIHGNRIPMPIVRMVDQEVDIDIILKLDFSLLCDVYTIVDMNNRNLGMPRIFENQEHIFWNTEEGKINHKITDVGYSELNDVAESNTTYLLPNKHEVYAYFSAIFNYQAFCE